MKRLLIATLVLALAASFAVVPTVAAGTGDVLWGVTGINFGAANEYSEVFKVDTSSGVVTMVNNDPANPVYSDIAVTPGGNVYAVGRTSPDHNFIDFFRLDANTGEVIATVASAFSDAGFYHVNALSAESDASLLAIEGGGVCPGWGTANPRLLRIALDGSGNLSGITSLGNVAASGAASMCSDGDLDKDPHSGKWYAGFWADAGSEMIEVNIASPGSSVLVSQSNIQWQGGFAYTADGTAYAGSWAQRYLYGVNVTGGGSALVYDLSGSLVGNIFGLSRDREALPSVGGTGIPTDKLGLMLPWILAAAALLILGGASIIISNRRRGAEKA